MAEKWVYPFGGTVSPRPPSAEGPRRAFVLGAYPSALHVSWTPPAGLGRRVRSLPVADELSPFWDGTDANRLVDQWRNEVGFSPDWGRVELPGSELNGSSGRPVEPMYLSPLGLARDDAWLTDCLDTYRASEGVARAIATVYDPIADELGLPRAQLGLHPAEAEIVAEARRDHSERLVSEIATCAPDTIITLGNAALRVLWSLPGIVPMRPDPPTALTPRDYGRPCDVRVDGRPVTLWAVGHPNIVRKNAAYAAAHDEWMRRMSATGAT